MKSMTARDAKNHFGELLDTTQREPVLVTKNDRPVAVMLSIKDVEDTLLADMFMQKEEGYDDWAAEKIQNSLRRFKDKSTNVSSHEAVMDRALTNVLK